MSLVLRLEKLFGRVWQAALGHSGTISRRRAREISAGEDTGDWLVAIIELLERTPPEAWPDRWRNFGKVSARCPTLEFFSDRLVEGQIRPEDAVLVWDLVIPVPGSIHHTNIAVGMLPTGAFAGLSRDHERRTAWRQWNHQWDSAHGGGMVSDWGSNETRTPEGMLGDWIARDYLVPADLNRALALLSDRIYGFNVKRAMHFADKARAAFGD